MKSLNKFLDKYGQLLQKNDGVLFAQDMKLTEGTIIGFDVDRGWLDIMYYHKFEFDEKRSVIKKYSQLKPENVLKIAVIKEAMPEYFV